MFWELFLILIFQSDPIAVTKELKHESSLCSVTLLSTSLAAQALTQLMLWDVFCFLLRLSGLAILFKKNV